jgi:hypothetical protein
LDKLSRAVNTNDKCDGGYGYRVSDRQGSTTHQEQIVFFYKYKTINPLETAHVKRGDASFERPPYIGIFEARQHPKFKFLSMFAHLKPTAAVEEMNALENAYKSAIRKFGPEYGLSSAFVMGDLNCDKPYVRASDWPKLKLAHERYMWFIKQGMDTMATKTDAAYDRIIMDCRFRDSYVKDSGKVFKYDEEFKVPRDLTLAVSNHYPVEISLVPQEIKIDYGEKQAVKPLSFWERIFGRKKVVQPKEKLPEHSEQVVKPVRARRKSVASSGGDKGPKIKKSAPIKEANVAKRRGRPPKKRESSEVPKAKRTRNKEPKIVVGPNGDILYDRSGYVSDDMEFSSSDED